MRLAARVLFALGAVLLTLNFAGLLFSLRPALPDESGGDRITLEYRQAMRQIEREPGETDAAYVQRLTTVVQAAMLTFWPSEGVDRYRLRVPAWENYILYARSFVEPGYFRRYEFVDYRRAIERGLGLCSQQAVALTEIVRERGMAADIVHLEGHVVARVRTDGSWVVADPYFGVVIPRDIAEIESRPEIVAPYYERAGYEASLVRQLVTIYGKADNRIYRDGPTQYLAVNYQSERASYYLIWLLPLLAMLPLSVSFLHRRLGRGQEGREPGHAPPDGRASGRKRG